MQHDATLYTRTREIATSTGRFALEQIARRREVQQNFKHDIKLAMDRACQDHAEALINQHFPDHAILGEEGTVDRPSDYTWVIDPIDGTMNYFHGLPHWCCSVAVMHHDQLVAGAVYLPQADELFAAACDRPAVLNDQVIRVSTTPTLDQAMVLYGLGKPLPGEGYDPAPFYRITHAAQKSRIMGAAAIDLCLVACGRADAYCDNGIQLWDYAAAQLIAERAGATFEIVEQHPRRGTRMVCSNGLIHDATRDVWLDA